MGSSANMDLDDESDSCDIDDCTDDASDENAHDSESDEDTASLAATMLDENLFDSLSQMVSRLCSVCESFFKGEFTVNKETFGPLKAGQKLYHSSLLSLEEAVHIGCPLCQELFNDLKLLREDCKLQEAKNQLFSIWCTLDTAYLSDVGHGITASFELRCQDRPDWLIKSLKFFPSTTLGLGTEFREPALRETTAKSARTVGLARSWYQDCLKHSSCRKGENGRFAPPTRLVRVQVLGNGVSYRIAANVCETSPSPDVAYRYATLSHRCGDGAFLKLDRSNIDTFRREIPTDQLSNLLKDAMYMTCQLDIEYIWIDCLCIIQGCKRDWDAEARRMGDYYRYAQCNLSASGYEDSSTGLFGNRVALSFIHYPIQMDCVLVNEISEYKERFHYRGIFIKADEFDFQKDVISGILSSRGWVAQERALSPGILHFTPRLTWWECNHHIVNEAFPSIKLVWADSKFLGAGAARSVNEAMSKDEVYSAWHEFIQHYATTDLTFETDRFPAVVGIARIYAALLDDNFIAGIWEGDLVRSLLWQRWPTGKARRLPSAQVAPSWSWAPLALAHYYPRSGHPINGIRFEVLWESPRLDSDLQTTTFERSSVQGLAVTGPLRRLSGEVDDLPNWKKFGISVTRTRDVDSAFYFSGQNTFGHEWRWKHHTHILVLWKYDVSASGKSSVEGLLLQQTQAIEARGAFRRLGIVRLDFLAEELCDRYLGLMKKDGSYMPSIDFEECGLQELVLI